MADWERQEGYDLSGKRALVVGFANPAGRAITEALAEAGADVAVASATMDGDEVMAAKRASRAVAKAGRQTFSQGWDVTLPTNVRVGLRQLVKEFGVPSVLVYNADLPLAKPIEKTGDAEFANVQAVNLSGAFYAARAWVRELGEGETGRLVFVSSILGERGVNNLSVYTRRGGVFGLRRRSARAAPASRDSIATAGWTGPPPVARSRRDCCCAYPCAAAVARTEPLACCWLNARFLSGQVFRIDGGVSAQP